VSKQKKQEDISDTKSLLRQARYVIRMNRYRISKEAIYCLIQGVQKLIEAEGETRHEHYSQKDEPLPLTEKPRGS